MNVWRRLGVVVLVLIALGCLVNLVVLVAASFLAKASDVSAQAIGGATFYALVLAASAWGVTKLVRARRVA